MWDLPAPGLEPVSPALAGGFLTTAPPGKPLSCLLDRIINHTERLKTYRLGPTDLIKASPLGPDNPYSYVAEENGRMKRTVVFTLHNHSLNLE